ncbi:hypothetical protein AABB24_006435 [Solanum stoloniferum]|uniref:Uncharacterized protein n=1 Tax=Solanum stoloniferum TaxID=62892 RepID=A0ABD2V1C4_9SOLN
MGFARIKLTVKQGRVPRQTIYRSLRFTSIISLPNAASNIRLLYKTLTGLNKSEVGTPFFGPRIYTFVPYIPFILCPFGPNNDQTSGLIELYSNSAAKSSNYNHLFFNLTELILALFYNSFYHICYKNK